MSTTKKLFNNKSYQKSKVMWKTITVPLFPPFIVSLFFLSRLHSWTDLQSCLRVLCMMWALLCLLPVWGSCPPTKSSLPSSSLQKAVKPCVGSAFLYHSFFIYSLFLPGLFSPLFGLGFVRGNAAHRERYWWGNWERSGATATKTCGLTDFE